MGEIHSHMMYTLQVSPSLRFYDLKPTYSYHIKSVVLASVVALFRLNMPRFLLGGDGCRGKGNSVSAGGGGGYFGGGGGYVRTLFVTHFIVL